jgi:hypothetical protein
MKAQMIEFGWDNGRRAEILRKIKALKERKENNFSIKIRASLESQIQELYCELGELESELQ